VNPNLSRAARFAAVLSTLHAAHDLADHVVQTDMQALRKAYDWRAMAGHVGSYHATQVAALVAADRVLGLGLSRWRVAAAVALSAGTHAVLDRRWPVRRLLELTGSEGFAASRTIVRLDVDGLGRVRVPAGVPTQVDAVGPVPLHGPYLADQSLHHACLWLAALIMAGGR
jgi:hypothetical protein